VIAHDVRSFHPGQVREWDQRSGRAVHATRVELAGSLAPHEG